MENENDIQVTDRIKHTGHVWTNLEHKISVNCFYFHGDQPTEDASRWESNAISRAFLLRKNA
jgi:hypothetical protein